MDSVRLGEVLHTDGDVRPEGGGDVLEVRHHRTVAEQSGQGLQHNPGAAPGDGVVGQLGGALQRGVGDTDEERDPSGDRFGGGVDDHTGIGIGHAMRFAHYAEERHADGAAGDVEVHQRADAGEIDLAGLGERRDGDGDESGGR